jgi:hypothetical protein
VSNWNSVGGAKPSIGIDPAAIVNADGPVPWNHVHKYPADGTFVAGSAGYVYRFAGGAPLYVSNWNAVGGPQPATRVDQAALENGDAPVPWNHVHKYPADGTFLSILSGAAHRVAGGAAIFISSWAPYGGAQPSTVIDKAAIDSAGRGVPWNHLRKVPADGTVLEGLASATFWELTAGKRFAVLAPQPTAIGVPDDALHQFPVLTVPGPASRVSAVAGNASATVSWTPPASNGNSAITSYTLTTSPGGRTMTLQPTVTTAVVTGLTNGTTYTFAVAAQNRLGSGQASQSNPVTPVAQARASDPLKPASCVVPNVKYKPLAAARRRITSARCATGRIARAKSMTVRKGRVISQSPKPGRRLAPGSKINLLVSRGRG